MNKLFILLLLLAATKSFGQTKNVNIPRIFDDTIKKTEIDTAFRIVYVDKIKPDLKPAHQPAIIINGKFVNTLLLNSLNPHKIENIEVLNGDTLIDNVQYYGKIHIKTKSDYNPKSISLTELKNKYTNLNGKPVIFMIDGNIVNADYDNYLIDENNLLTIIVDKFQNAKENIDLGLIKLLTKSEGNIKNRKNIIRGTEVTMNK